MDSHTDTVGVGDPKEWAWDPYQGKVEDGYVYGEREIREVTIR